MQPFVDELLLYPRGKHDDLLDGFFYANKNAYRPAHKVVLKKEHNNLFVRKRKNWRTL